VRTQKPEVNIKDWCIAPALGFGLSKSRSMALYGVPENHPNPYGYVSNKKIICSSPIVKQDLDNQTVVTENTRYKLVGPGITEDELNERIRLMLLKSLN